MGRNIRLGQLLTPFGIGQLVNFPNDETLMICGLDSWEKSLQQRANNVGQDHIDLTEFIVNEPRLQQLLGVSHFRKPYPFRERGNSNTRLSIPSVRFPQWHYCVNCGVMAQIELTRQEIPACNQSQCNGRLIPVRFVAVCPRGHIQDVPFLEWVHRNSVDQNIQHVLTYRTGKGSGDLSSIAIECSCGERRTLGGIMNDGALDTITNCQGHRPWLGPRGISLPQSCDNSLRVLIKGGANVHYSTIRSALYLPEMGATMPELVVRIIERDRNTIIDMSNVDQDHRSLKLFLASKPEVRGNLIDIDDLYEWIVHFLNEDRSEGASEITNDLDIRVQEYQYLNTGRNSENADFKAIVHHFSDNEAGKFLAEYFEHVVLISKLRETRVFAGFSRITSEDGRTLEDRVRDLSLDNIDWLPAHVVYGEGIFIKFKEDKINQWLELLPEGSFEIIRRYHSIQRQRIDNYEDRDVNPAFIMIHTFAHLLINRLCFNCGYGSSSLRERIYFSSGEQTMYGVLIYTSSGDSEGSMGGLVRQGREENFYPLIRDVIEDSRWCSADPVCMDVGTSEGQGPESLNGASCHNCAIVPETSCEEFNILLDRSVITGTNDDPSIGYFN